MIIKSLLDTDFYKLTMMQAVFHQYPDVTTGWRFVCRNKDVNLSHLLNDVKKEVKQVSSLKFQKDEIQYLKDRGFFKEDFLTYLQSFQLNHEDLIIEIQDGQLAISVKDNTLWLKAILWEIYILSIINELYFKEHQNLHTYRVGFDKLMNKVELVKNYQNSLKELAKADPRYVFKFIEFGTRRRFSSEWQDEVVSILKDYLPENLTGTSNVYLAKKHGLKPIGTMAHEYLMAHQALSKKIVLFQNETLESWRKEYGDVLMIALTDVISSKSFFDNMTPELAKHYQGYRQDSGDPVNWAINIVLPFLKKHDIDPAKKTLVFSDSLDIPKSIKLHQLTVNKIGSFMNAGIGTNLTNDLGVKALNVVMKMTTCNGQSVAKISDEPSKSICLDTKYLSDLKKMFLVEE